MTIRLTRIGRRTGLPEDSLLSITHFHWVEDGTELPGIFSPRELCEFIKGGGDVYIVDKSWRRVPVLLAHLPDKTPCVRAGADEMGIDHLLRLELCDHEE